MKSKTQILIKIILTVMIIDRRMKIQINQKINQEKSLRSLKIIIIHNKRLNNSMLNLSGNKWTMNDSGMTKIQAEEKKTAKELGKDGEELLNEFLQNQ